MHKGRGCSIYNASNEVLFKLQDELRKAGRSEFKVFSVSSLKDVGQLNKHTIILIFQDLDHSQLIDKAEKLVNELIYPAWYKGCVIFFVSKIDKSCYDVGEIDPLLVHSDYKYVLSLLYIEQLGNLLDTVNVTITSKQSAYSTIEAIIHHKLIENENESLIPQKEKSINSYELGAQYVLDDLNDEQKAAVEHINGPMRVLAPAGSGKTKTLVNRIVNLVNNGVKQSEILALAFNKKAEIELIQRIKGNFELNSVSIKTFHSFGNEIIKNTLRWQFEENNQDLSTTKILKDIMQKHEEKTNQEGKHLFDACANMLIKVKNDLLTISEMEIEIDEGLTFSFLPILKDYLQKCKEHQIYNFDDMLYIALHQLLLNPVLRKNVQEKYKYILVDEFQDLNKLQLLLIQVLAMPQNNLFVVGDDDQMIYGFRGAEVRHILEFSKKYAIASHQVLKINYRSCSNICRFAKRLIDCNKLRVPKDITPNSKEEGEINLFIGDSLESQAEKIALWIRANKNINTKWSDFAILYRYNQYSDTLSVVLSKLNIPVQYLENNDVTYHKEIQNGNDNDKVILTTIHKTKGNEYKHVIVYNLVGKLTGRLTEAQLEEERRIAYVAVTRAKKTLLVTSQQGELSPFIEEFFLDPAFKKIEQKTIRNRIFVSDVKINILRARCQQIDKQIQELMKKYPELEGIHINVGGILRNLRQNIRQRRIASSLKKINHNNYKKSMLYEKIETLKSEKSDMENELEYRKLLKKE